MSSALGYKKAFRNYILVFQTPKDIVSYLNLPPTKKLLLMAKNKNNIVFSRLMLILHADSCPSSPNTSECLGQSCSLIKISTDLQSNRIASDDLILTVSVSVDSNYNPSTLNHISLNYTSYLHYSATDVYTLTIFSCCFSPPRFILPIFLKVTGTSMTPT